MVSFSVVHDDDDDDDCIHILFAYCSHLCSARRYALLSFLTVQQYSEVIYYYKESISRHVNLYSLCVSNIEYIPHFMLMSECCFALSVTSRKVTYTESECMGF